MLMMVLIMRQDFVGNGCRWLKETFDEVVNSDAGLSAFAQDEASPKDHRAR